jgi:DNA-binding CsgD family transcriptional regulator
VKKGDPVSTIIIGGQDENFVHFIMNENLAIELIWNDKEPGFKHCIMNGGKVNSELQYIFGLQKELSAPPAIPSKQNRELLKGQVIQKYHSLVDTSSFSIIKLLAIYLMSESVGKPDLQLMEKLNNTVRLADSTSPYYLAFVDRLDYLKFQSEKSEVKNPAWIKWAGLLVLVLLLGLAFWGRVRRKLKSRSKPKTELVSSLSIQEKRVFDLLKTGASNKEISNELNIEVSTVKSHVNKIYSRLGVKSRKEIVNKDWE